jgi:hypothetical protein
MPMKKYKPGQIVKLSAASFLPAFVARVSRPLLVLIVDEGRKAEETRDQYTKKNPSDNIRPTCLSFAFVCTNLLRPKWWRRVATWRVAGSNGRGGRSCAGRGPGKPGLNTSGAG